MLLQEEQLLSGRDLHGDNGSGDLPRLKESAKKDILQRGFLV